jgi:hypothetical protein
MPTYFINISSLHRFTMEFDHHQNELQCHNCLKNDQFVSHGFVYKQVSSTQKIIVGKRIFCANRCGKSGCGATHRLYLSDYLPSLCYTTEQLFTFLSSLIDLSTIQHAYQAATHTENPRNAYRWLHKLGNKLIDFRSRLTRNSERLIALFKTRTHRLRLLLPTLQTLFSALPDNPCAHYQQLRQSAFM